MNPGDWDPGSIGHVRRRVSLSPVKSEMQTQIFSQGSFVTYPSLMPVRLFKAKKPLFTLERFACSLPDSLGKYLLSAFFLATVPCPCKIRE